jgi:hypothetical protein
MEPLAIPAGNYSQPRLADGTGAMEDVGSADMAI